ncbi:MAG: heme-binding protein [Methyloversatilis sp.]|uniref:GlcG/HbpS family heme-binding protein n=1 Tax=Methyloversatilis sp. TaxID=2569862 RepID=UPI0027357C18|nr:heme-binding protein [Methyloversatilis sp.]MDP3874863.1 heme-binding protein [Methyloversatilis sp.]
MSAPSSGSPALCGRIDLPSLDWRAAQRAVAAAVAQAESLGIRVDAALVDRSGNTLAFLRMPGAFLHSADLAVDKAYTAASFGFPTGDWMKVIGGDERLKTGLSSRPRLVVLGGGLPLFDGDECVGGIGVSGGSEAQDEDCAQAALDALRAPSS